MDNFSLDSYVRKVFCFAPCIPYIYQLIVLNMFISVKRNFLLKLALLVSVAHVHGASAQSLEGAVHSAISNHPQIEQAQARLGVAAEEVSSSRSGFFPSLSLGATAGRIYNDNATTRGSTTSRGAAYSGLGEGTASLRQPIFDGFDALSRVRSSKAGQKSAGLQLQDVRERLAYQTVETYLNVLQSRLILGRIQGQEAKVNDYIQRIETNVDDGGGDESQLQQANDVRVLLNGFVADYTGQLRTAESQFIELTGESPFKDIKDPVLDITALPATIEEAIELANSVHPAVRASLEDARSASYDVDSEKSNLYPQLLGELSYLKTDRKEVIGGETEDQRAVLRLNWDFETGGGQFARIKQRRYEYAQAQARKKEITRQIERDIRIAYAERDVAVRRLKNQKERVQLNKKLFDTYEAQFEGGVVNLLQLMQSDNQLFNTEVEEIVYKYRLLTSQYAIIASLGRLQDTLFQGASTQELQASTQKAAVNEQKQ